MPLYKISQSGWNVLACKSVFGVMYSAIFVSTAYYKWGSYNCDLGSPYDEYQVVFVNFPQHGFCCNYHYDPNDYTNCISWDDWTEEKLSNPPTWLLDCLNYAQCEDASFDTSSADRFKAYYACACTALTFSVLCSVLIAVTCYFLDKNEFNAIKNVIIQPTTILLQFIILITVIIALVLGSHEKSILACTNVETPCENPFNWQGASPIFSYMLLLNCIIMSGLSVFVPTQVKICCLCTWFSWDFHLPDAMDVDDHMPPPRATMLKYLDDASSPKAPLEGLTNASLDTSSTSKSEL